MFCCTPILPAYVQAVLATGLLARESDGEGPMLCAVSLAVMGGGATHMAAHPALAERLRSHMPPTRSAGQDMRGVEMQLLLDMGPAAFTASLCENLRESWDQA